MANRAYLRVWTRDFSLETMIAEFARFLASVPLSESHAGFDQLTVQAVDATETPIVEWDFHEQNYGPAEVAALVAFVCSPLSSATNGAALRVDGGVVRSIV